MYAPLQVDIPCRADSMVGLIDLTTQWICGLDTRCARNELVKIHVRIRSAGLGLCHNFHLPLKASGLGRLGLTPSRPPSSRACESPPSSGFEAASACLCARMHVA